eukprot:TRINITY_DN34813_c0_g1_i1.p1 TRINITY_DN34813_c0_g1~~TRINITY_DN34813_c0_g1_i1.p1  ORF type:complete len:942 (-),score=249.91 TRINITY_DN34813_c0_g1_i1:76-2901(-)
MSEKSEKDYQRLEVLGRGSYGSAILVKEKNSTSGCPLRVLKEIDMSRIPQAAAKEAQKEADVLRSLSHPNIVAYFGTFLEGQKLCIVMEYADGGDMSANVKLRKKEGRWHTEDEAIHLFAQCCLALRHVHSKHVMHRDLKSQNIFMTKANVVKLGDFGIAKVLDHTAAEAKTMIGTPVYLAPEVCHSQPYGIKADIWSMGVVLYELLALQVPFQGENLPALIMKIVQANPEPLPAQRYSEQMRGLCHWMLQKQPQQRPSIDQVLARPILRAFSGASGSSGREAAAAGGCDSPMSGMPSPPDSAAKRCPLPRAPPSSAGSDVVSEFRRNREMAARTKARAEGELQMPSSERRRSQSVDSAAGQKGGLSAPGDEASSPYPPARSKASEHAARRRAEEASHLQALQEAAAQARRDRRQVQQRMQELERPGPPSPAESERPDGTRLQVPASRPRARSCGASGGRDSAEEMQHLQALQEARVQARRDRLEIKQRIRDAEASAEKADRTCASPCRGQASPRHPSEGGILSAADKRAAEARHLEALAEASAQARRERRLLKQRMQEETEPSCSFGEEEDVSMAELLPRDAAGPPAANRGGLSPQAVAEAKRKKEEKEEVERLDALRQARLQAQRDRKAIQQKRLEELQQQQQPSSPAGVVVDEAHSPLPPQQQRSRSRPQSWQSPTSWSSDAAEADMLRTQHHRGAYSRGSSCGPDRSPAFSRTRTDGLSSALKLAGGVLARAERSSCSSSGGLDPPGSRGDPQRSRPPSTEPFANAYSGRKSFESAEQLAALHAALSDDMPLDNNGSCSLDGSYEKKDLSSTRLLGPVLRGASQPDVDTRPQSGGRASPAPSAAAGGKQAEAVSMAMPPLAPSGRRPSKEAPVGLPSKDKLVRDRPAQRLPGAYSGEFDEEPLGPAHAGSLRSLGSLSYSEGGTGTWTAFSALEVGQ